VAIAVSIISKTNLFPKPMIFRTYIWLLVAWSVIGTGMSFAGVNLKNGNFYISYTDLISPPTAPGQVSGKIEIVRTYNSRATETSEFGYGWGWDFSTYLSTDNEGGITVHENGSGALRFVSGASSLSRSTARTQMILDIAALSPDLPDLTAQMELGGRLKADKESRLAQTLNFVSRGLENMKHPPSGWQKTDSYNCGNPACRASHGYVIKRTSSGYQRRVMGGRTETFDLAGRLVLQMEANGYWFRIQRDESGRVRHLSDVNGYEVWFDLNADGLVTQIRDSDGQTATYKYKDSDLVWSKDTAGNIYTHEYDAKHNMTAVSYPDGTRIQIGYNKSTAMTERVVNRDGTSAAYEYGSDPKDPSLHYWTIVRQMNADGTPKSDNMYDYTFSQTPEGLLKRRQITLEKRMEKHREVSTYLPSGSLGSKDINGAVTRYEYHPTYGLPVSIISPESETRYTYDPQRRLVTEWREKDMKSGMERVVTFDYSLDFQQLREMTEDGGIITRFHYAEDGTTISSFTRAEEKVALERDRHQAVLRVSLDQTATFDFAKDKLQPHGFSLSGAGDDAIKQKLTETLATVQKLVNQSYFADMLVLE